MINWLNYVEEMTNRKTRNKRERERKKKDQEKKQSQPLHSTITNIKLWN